LLGEYGMNKVSPGIIRFMKTYKPDDYKRYMEEVEKNKASENGLQKELPQKPTKKKQVKKEPVKKITSKEVKAVFAKQEGLTSDDIRGAEVLLFNALSEKLTEGDASAFRPMLDIIKMRHPSYIEKKASMFTPDDYKKMWTSMRGQENE